jgi:hypothetical protein
MAEPRFEIRPLGAWDRPRTTEAQRARFRAGWNDTVGTLLYEVEQLGGHLVVVQVDADASQIRRDGMLYARAQVASPAVKVSFESRHGPLTYATDRFDHWQDNVRAIALALGALRAVDRYGVSGSGEQYRGWTQIAATAAESEMTPGEACRVLADAAGMPADHAANLATPAIVIAAYRKAARTAHPDAGGNADVFRLITKARDVLLAAR